MSTASNSSAKVIEGAKLSDYTTFRLGGPCLKLFECPTPESLEQTIKELVKQSQPYILIGGGSNLVVSDKGINAAVVRYASQNPDVVIDDDTVTVSGATQFDDLARICAEKGLSGLDTCHGIPGTVGGAVVGNAGAFGKQIGDVVTAVTVIDKLGQRTAVAPESLEFSYRYSNLRESGDIVVSIQVKLTLADKEELLKQRDEILKTRQEKHPDLKKEPCAGSFFRNIEPTSKAGKRQATGHYLEEAGGKNLKCGGAYIYPKHANIIIKGESATAEDVYQLSQKMAALAKEKFDLELIREVKFVGEFDGAPVDRNTHIW